MRMLVVALLQNLTKLVSQVKAARPSLVQDSGTAMLLQQLNISMQEKYVEAELGAELARGAKVQVERDFGFGGTKKRVL